MFLKHFIRIYIPGAGARSKKIVLRLQQNVATPPAPAPQHWLQHYSVLNGHYSDPDNMKSRL
jgi:hypothetical protein